MTSFKQRIDLRFLVIFVTLACPVGMRAQEALNTIQNRLAEYDTRMLHEKLYLHSNKSFYLAGEILWFKIYELDGNSNRPLGFSSVAYVELIDLTNKPVFQSKVFLKDGSGNGSFYLPLNLKSGRYQIRAYTNWMKNEAPEFFFHKVITVVNTKRSEPIQKDTIADTVAPQVHFFPEGGNLVAGLNSRVAFKVNGPCEGAVVTENHDTVLRFKSPGSGIGHFDFQPREGMHYHAFVFVAGQFYEENLPEIFSQGYVLRVDSEADEHLRLIIKTNLGSVANPYLLIHTRQTVKVAREIAIVNGEGSFSLDKNLLGDGISHITVFNHEGQPVCERLVFKYPSRRLNIRADLGNGGGLSYGIRQRIDIGLNTSNAGGKAVYAGLSLSVFRLDSLQTVSDGEIEGYIWLNSDLGGRVENPGYYFSGIGASTAEEMDELMLTQGWRKFDWKKLLGGEKPVLTFAPELHGHLITGRIENIKTGQPAKDITGYLSIPSTYAQLAVSTSDSSGAVRFEMSKMFGSSELIVQTGPMDSDYRVDISSPFIEKYADYSIEEWRPSHDFGNSLRDQHVAMQALNIYHSESLKNFSLPGADTIPFYRKLAKSYLLDDYTRFQTMEEVLREYVDLISVKGRKGQFQISVIDTRHHIYFEDDPLILLDGVPVFDVNRIIAFDPLKVRKLDVLNDRYIFGNTSFEGVMSFITYRGNLAGFDLDPKATLIDYEGLQQKREFYNPDYGREDQRESSLPDFRNALYWNPELQTDSAGKGHVSFYSSDLGGRFAVVVEGISPDGGIGTKIVVLKVKQ